MLTKFNLHIGDWSDDGHGKEEVFCVETNKTVEDFRDAYTEFNEKYPDLNLEKICSDYGDHYLKRDKADTLVGLGIKDLPFEEQCSDDLWMTPEDLAELTMQACQLMDKTLEYQFINEGIPTFHNYGWDEKKRHIHGPGYGCFE